jgi:ATP-dependent protease HslVU (ClpYQ) peptidase subunit
MTTIVGVQGDGFAVICVDSRISTMFAGGLVQVGTLKEGSSKVSTNGKYLLGAAGDVRAINIIHHVFQPPPPPPNLRGKKLDQFFTAKFIPALRECFDAQGYSVPDLNENKEHIAEQGSSILVVVNGTIYIVDGDYSWASDASGIYSIGSGSSYAFGALQVLANNKKLTIQQAKTIALKALNIAAKYDPYTGAPYQTLIQECEANSKRRKPV